MAESLITQSLLDQHTDMSPARRVHNGIIFGKGYQRLAALKGFPVHAKVGNQLVPIDTRWQTGTLGELGTETLLPRIFPSVNEVRFKDLTFCFQPFAVGTVTLDPLEFDLIVQLPTGRVEGNCYIIEVGDYTYTLTLHEKNRIKADIILPSKPPGLAGDYFVIANKILDADFFSDVIMVPDQTYKDVFTFNKGLATDAEENTVVVKNIVRTIGGQKYLLSGVPLDWLDSAVYPVHIDPTVSLQPAAAAGYDSSAFAGTPTEGYGASTEMWCGTQTSDERAFYLKFDLSSIDDFAGIISAVITLYRNYNQGIDAGDYVDLMRIRRAWTEGGVCWNYYTGTSSWTAPPGANTTSDIYTQISGERAYLPAGTGSNDYHDFPVAGSIQSFLDGTVTNNGWIGRFDSGSESTDGQRFTTSDHLTAAYRPEIVIEYIAKPIGPSWFF